MNKILRHYSFILSIVFFAASCQTTTVQHDKKEGTISLFSQVDPASNDKNLKSDPKTENVINEIKLKLQKNPRDVESYLTLANIYAALSKHTESIRYAKTALRFDLKEHRARVILAQNYYRLKKFKLAEVILTSLPSKFDNNADILNLRALIAYSRNRRGDSWQLFKYGTDKHPRNVSLAMNYGVLLLQHRQTKLAKTQFNRVLKNVPDHKDAMIHLAIISATEGNFDDAEDKISSLTTDKNRLNKFNLGVIAFAKGDFSDAEIHLKRFISDRGASKSSIESAGIILEQIAFERERLVDEELNKDEDLSNKKNRNTPKTEADKEIDDLEKELLK
jgi:Tfp pilus assembly protein PilF